MLICICMGSSEYSVFSDICFHCTKTVTFVVYECVVIQKKGVNEGDSHNWLLGEYKKSKKNNK